MPYLSPLRWATSITAALVIGVPGVSLGLPIAIANHSFEETVLADGYYTVNNVPGWLGEASWYHVGNPTDVQFSGTSDGTAGPSPIHGQNVAAVNNYGHLIYQQLTATVQPYHTYTLSALVGHRFSVPFDDGSVNLIAGDRFLGRAFASPAEGQFTRVTVVFNSGDAAELLGQQLRIELRSAGTIAQAWFDDIQLDAVESAPGTLASTLTPYIPLLSINPDYIARRDQDWSQPISFDNVGGPLTPHGGGNHVPEGGSTLAMLGFSAFMLVMARRRKS